MNKPWADKLDAECKKDELWGEQSGYSETREEYLTRMEDEGFEVVFPESNELLIDIDTEEQYRMFKLHYERLRDEQDFKTMSYTEHFSKSGPPRRHIHLKMPWSMSPIERIAWQAVLGSDVIRELLSMIRLYRGDGHPTLFAEPKRDQ